MKTNTSGSTKKNSVGKESLPATKDEKIIIYTDDKGNTELRADVEKETVWASQTQIESLFDVDQSVVSRHIKNIFSDGEVDRKSNMQKMHNANSDRPILLYSLDIILAVGYRTNSIKAIQFRIWATKILREYVVRGYSLNRQIVSKSPEKLEGLQETIALIESTENPGKLKGKISIKLTKNLESKDD